MTGPEFWQSFWILAHLLLFAYWLGGDLGVFYASRYRNRGDLDIKTRLLIGKITAAIDMSPRTTLVLMLPVGLTLAANLGLSPVTGVWLALVWIASLAWLLLVWTVHLKKGTERARQFANLDMLIRAAVVVVLTVAAIATFVTGEPFVENWLALKVLLFAGTVFCGIMIRFAIKPYGVIFEEIVAEGSTPEREARFKSAAKVSRFWVKSLWALLLVAAWVGIAKPWF